MVKRSLLFAALLFLTAGCQKTGFLTRYGIFHVKKGETNVATMDGTIGGRTEKHFDRLIKDYPELEVIVLGNCPGSKNDDVNLKVSKKIYDAGINTYLNADSEIASGAVDLFLAGNKRTIVSGAKIGVHSWSGDGKEADQLAVDDPEHDLYIEYYKSVGFTEQEARDFYFFTINAASASSIHWMTQSEIVQYGMAR
ncbi:MAG: hypothetical protein MK066_04165 [Crocinitomicaceae bacterium]|nr:hypothetical protein [Crocinitomicaceae bacterium]